jgi:YidC/Oxa1 family membrane protein insertase
MMEMYRKEKINPLGGCLPVVIQIPVFISLYWVLLSSVELRGAPWVLWVHDLSLPDTSISDLIGLKSIPIGILPIIMAVACARPDKPLPSRRVPPSNSIWKSTIGKLWTSIKYTLAPFSMVQY